MYRRYRDIYIYILHYNNTYKGIFYIIYKLLVTFKLEHFARSGLRVY